MALHPGIFVRDAGTDDNAARLALAGLIARNTAGKVRAGVLPAHTNPLVTARASVSGSLAVDVAAFEAVTVRDPAGIEAVVMGNDGLAQVLFDPAPVSNSRIDRVWVKHNDVDLGDATSVPQFGVAKGTAAPSPLAPAVPAGCLSMAQVTIPAGVTATTAVGVAVTQDYPFSTVNGGIMLLRSQAEQDAWTPHNGALAYRIDQARKYIRRNGAWVSDLPVLPHREFTFNRSAMPSGTVNAWTIGNVPGRTNDATFVTAEAPNLLRFTEAGIYDISWGLNLGGAATGRVLVSLEAMPGFISGQGLRSIGAAGDSVLGVSGASIYIAANTTVALVAVSAVSGSTNIISTVAVTQTGRFS